MKKQLSLPLKKNKRAKVTIERVRHCCHLINEGMSMNEALTALSMGKQYGRFMQDAGIAKKLKNGKWTALKRVHEDRFNDMKKAVNDYYLSREKTQVISPKMSAAPEQMSLLKRFFLYLKQIFSI
jgi:hypothetical protein